MVLLTLFLNNYGNFTPRVLRLDDKERGVSRHTPPLAVVPMGVLPPVSEEAFQEAEYFLPHRIFDDI